jgi:hypothetical protein
VKYISSFNPSGLLLVIHVFQITHEPLKGLEADAQSVRHTRTHWFLALHRIYQENLTVNSSAVEGIIRVDEAYSKKMILNRLGISQKFWDKMLDEGLPYTTVGHSRWVTGKDLIEHFRRKAVRKTE